MNKKLELILKTLVYTTVVPGGKWSSSAKNYQDFLQSRGIKLPFQLFYQYKYPDNMTPQKFEEVLLTSVFALQFNPMRIENPRAYAESIISDADKFVKSHPDVQPLSETEKSDIMHKMCDPVKNLSDSDKVQLIDYIKQKSKTAVTQIADLFYKVADLNPELMDINLANASLNDLFEILDGVSYGYAPVDIKYYIENKGNLEQIRKAQRRDEFVKLIGSEPHIFIHPDRIQIMLDEIKKQKMMQHNTERE